MSKRIKFTLIKSLIVNTVKNVTFEKGMVDKGSDARNVVPAYHAQAGDEQYHERLLSRGYYTNVELLKTRLSDYLDGPGNLADDPLVSDEERDGTNEIVLKVSDRFNDGYTKSLARLCSRFIEDSMIADWYAILDDRKSAYFAALAEKDMASVMQAFTKSAPTPPAYRFPTAIELRYPVLHERDGIPGVLTPDNSGHIQDVQLYTNAWTVGIGDDSEISYILTGEDGRMPIDDIVVRCDNTCCRPEITPEGRWQLHAVSTGFTVVTLFSRHNDQVYNKFAVRIVP